MSTQNFNFKIIMEKADEIFDEKSTQCNLSFKRETDKIETEKKIVFYIINELSKSPPTEDFVEIDITGLLTNPLISKTQSPSHIINDCVYLIKELIDDIQVADMTKNGHPLLIISSKKP